MRPKLPQAWTAYALFAAVALFAQGTLLFGPRPDVVHPWADVAALVILVTALPLGMLGLAWSGPSGRTVWWLPFLFLVIVALWRHASGGATSGLTAMAGLSVLWLGLYGTRRQVWACVVAVGVVLIGPLLVIGAPDYPIQDWPRAVLYVAFSALLGPLTHQLVAQREADALRIRALEPADSRFRGLLEAAVGHAVVSTDETGLITVLNPGAEILLGWEEAEVLGRLPLASLVPVAELGARAAELGVEAGFESLVAPVRDGGSETRDWTWITKAGAWRTVSLTMSRVVEAGRLTGFIGIATDVTEQRTTERALVAQREVLRLVVDHLPNTVVGLLDRDLRWRTIAGQWLVGRGIDPEFFLGRVVGERLDVLDPDGLRGFLDAAFTSGQQGEFETERGVWFEIDAEPVTGTTGEPLLLMVCRDVTARRLADVERTAMVAALRASEEGFRTAFEQAPVGIALTSLGAGAQTRFLRVNAAFADLLGREADTVAGLAVDDITHPDDRDRRPARTGSGVAYEVRYLTPAGRTVWAAVRATEVPDSEGRPAYVLNHVRDETARHASEQALFEALEQQRAATAALRELDEVRVDTMSTISHELRTPLTSIGGYLELLVDEVPGPLTEQQGEMLEVVTRNADRLHRLVDDLLELSRLDHGASADAGTERVDLSEVARAVVETVRPVAGRKGQRLELTLGPGPYVVQGSTEQLDRVLTNLVANAVKYTPEGGRVDIALAAVEGAIRLEVTDTGIGIPEEEQRRLFDRFFRASTAIRKGIEGTGLGLAIVKSIVDRHQGTLVVESTPGEGSSFVVSLPVRVRRQPEPSR